MKLLTIGAGGALLIACAAGMLAGCGGGSSPAIGAAHGHGLDSAEAQAAGRQAVATARKLLGQSWPASAQSDVHTLAVAFDTINEDIASGNMSKYEDDGTTLNADSNVVRAELGLPSIK